MGLQNLGQLFPPPPLPLLFIFHPLLATRLAHLQQQKTSVTVTPTATGVSESVTKTDCHSIRRFSAGGPFFWDQKLSLYTGLRIYIPRWDHAKIDHKSEMTLFLKWSIV